MSNDQIQQRRENLEALRALGVEPYPYRFEVTHHTAEVMEAFDALAEAGETVAVAGRLMALRSHGKSTFAHLQDAQGRLQLYFKLDVVGEALYAIVKLLDVGDLVGVRGRLFRTRTGEMTVEVRELTFLAKCLRPLPEKWHGLKDTETRYRQRYLDLIVNEDAQRIFRGRAKLIRAMRAFLDERGFLEVDTPVLQALYGGAFARPFLTHHEALDMDLYLRISDELYLKRLIVGGLERVYEIARDFRNEGIDRTHNPEFTMLEYYQAYADYEDMMGVTEALVAHAVREAAGGYQVTVREHTVDFSPPWARVSYFDAVREATGVDLSTASEEQVRAAADRLGIDLKGKLGIAQAIDEIFSETVEAEPHPAHLRDRLSRSSSRRWPSGTAPGGGWWSASSCSWPGWRSPTRSASRTIPPRSRPRSICRPSCASRGIRRRSPPTPTTCGRWRPGCRPPAGWGSASTGWSWSPPAR